MTKQEKARKKEDNKKINKYLKGLIQEHAKDNGEFGKIKKTVEMILWLWVGFRILLVVADFTMLSHLGEPTSSVNAYGIAIVICFVEWFKTGSRWGAILPLIGAVIDVLSLFNEGIMTLFTLGDSFITSYATVVLITVVYQASVMLYILFSPQARAYQNEINALKEKAKTMDLAA